MKESIEIKSRKTDENTTDWFNKNKFKKYQPLLTAANLITKTKYVNSSIMTLKTWLIILTKIQLVKYLLQKI